MRYLKFLCLAFCIVSLNVGAQETIADSSFTFTSNTAYEKLPAFLSSAKLETRSSNQFNFGVFQKKYAYIFLKISAPTLKNAGTIFIDNTSLDSVWMYQASNIGTLFILYVGGNLVRYAQKRKYVWHTATPHTGNRFVYLLLKFNVTGQNINVRYALVSDEALAEKYRAFDRVILFYTGVITCILVVTISGLVILRMHVLLLYPLYVLSVFCWIMSHYGYLFPYIYPKYPLINIIVKPVSSITASLLLANLLKILFLPILAPGAYKVLQIINRTGFILLAAYAVMLVGFRSNVSLLTVNLVWQLFIVFLAICIFVILTRLRRPDRTVMIFSCAVSVMLLMVVFQILTNAGFFTSTFLNDHGLLLSSLLEILLMSIGVTNHIWLEKQAVANRINMLEAEKNEVLKSLISSQENERRRIGEDLHDSIGPMLAAIKINLLRIVHAKPGLERKDELISKTENIINDSVQEIRNISHQLMPKNLASKGLIGSLQEYFEGLSQVNSLPVYFDHSMGSSLTDEQQLMAYRIITELTLNAVKHSRATAAYVSFTTNKAYVEMTVRDNGIGFDAEHQPASTLGLASVKAKVNYLCGRIDISSSPDKGTRIYIQFPAA